MAAGPLPEDGELRLGPVRLPAGRRVTPYDHDEPVAWVTRRTVPDPGLVWSALTDLYGETGLVPVVLNDDEDDVDDLFMEPCDVAELDPLDPAELLATRWQGELDDDDDEEPVHWETPRVNEFLGLKRAGEGGNSLFDIVWAIAKRIEDPEAQAELSGSVPSSGPGRTGSGRGFWPSGRAPRSGCGSSGHRERWRLPRR
jgi:hypothetical protein